MVRFSKLDTNNWKPLLAFRKRLIAGEVTPESSTPSVAPTAAASETTTARGIRNMTCRPISAVKKQQILDLARIGMVVSQIAAEVGAGVIGSQNDNDRTQVNPQCIRYSCLASLPGCCAACCSSRSKSLT